MWYSCLLSTSKLREKCRALGLGCDIIPKVELDGVTVSSTYIRSLVEAGEVERAARFLGHPHRMSGTVRHGEGLSLIHSFSLAIGKEGQNARLAARLVGYKIDIKPKSYKDEE